jgi:hypothetical protein
MQPLEALLRPVAMYAHGPDSNRVDWWRPLNPEAEHLDSNSLRLRSSSRKTNARRGAKSARGGRISESTAQTSRGFF